MEESVIISLIILTYGDPFASIVGLSFKGLQISKNKTLTGSLGGAIISSILCTVAFLKI